MTQHTETQINIQIFFNLNSVIVKSSQEISLSLFSLLRHSAIFT